MVEQPEHAMQQADYVASPSPKLLRIPRRSYLAIDVNGDVLSDLRELRAATETVVAALGWGPPSYRQLPLEGFWHHADHPSFDPALRGIWEWTAGICLPDDPDEELVRRLIPRRRDAPPGTPGRVGIRHLEDGLVAQALHVGPFDTIGTTIDRVRRYAARQGLEASGTYQEIYLTDPQVTHPPDLRTIVRQPVRRRGSERGRPPSLLATIPARSTGRRTNGRVARR